MILAGLCDSETAAFRFGLLFLCNLTIFVGTSVLLLYVDGAAAIIYLVS